jgi:hypothetical protein
MRFPLGNSPFGNVANPSLYTVDIAGRIFLIFLAVLSDFNKSTDIELFSALVARYAFSYVHKRMS